MNVVAELIAAARHEVRALARDNRAMFYSALVKQYGERCLRCGSVDDLQIDHVIPVAQGGPSRLTNLQLLCAACNNAKGNTTRDYRAGAELPPRVVVTTINADDVEGEARRLLALLDALPLPVRLRHNVDSLLRKVARGGRIGVFEFAKIAATAARFHLISEEDEARVKSAARSAFDAAFLGDILAEAAIVKEMKEKKKAKKAAPVQQSVFEGAA